MTEEKNLVDPKEYGYSPDQVCMIPAHLLTDFMNVFQDVIASQPTMGALYVYPESVENISDDSGNLIESRVNWKPFDENTGAQAFFKASETPLPVTTRLGVLSERAYFTLLRIHQDNINKGIAKKVEDLEKEDIFKNAE